MISYELALKLKENCCGHDLHLIHHDNDEGGDVGNDYSHGSYGMYGTEEEIEKYWSKVNDSYVKCPTLSELIEACEKELGGIKRTLEGNGWLALNKVGDYMLPAYSTPEEAVANLWLELNKK